MLKRVSACAIALMLAASMVGCAQAEQGGSVDGRESSSQQVSGSAEGLQYEGEDDGSPEAAQAGDARPAIDLDDAADRLLVNKRLSWLSLVSADGGSYADPSTDTLRQVSFATRYLALTDYGTWEFGDYTAIAGPGGGAMNASNCRVEAAQVESVVRDLFGVSPDFDVLGTDELFTYLDGYVYFGVTGPVGQSVRFSAATSSEDIGQDRCRVAFNLYYDVDVYRPKDDAFYSSDAPGMDALTGSSGPASSSEAVIRMVERDGEKSFVIESYGAGDSSLSRSASAGADEGASSNASEKAKGAEANNASTDASAVDGDFRTRFEVILSDKARDYRMGSTTADMIQAGNDYYELYDELMSDVIAYLETRPDMNSSELAAEQDAWREEMRARANEAAAEMGGGSLTGPAVLGVEMQMQEERLAELIAMAER